MGMYRYLVRFPPDRIGPMCERVDARPSPTLLALTHGSDPEASQITIGKSPHLVARALEVPVIYEAVNLHHELPPSFYDGLHEQWAGVFEDLSVRYSLAEEVEDIAARLPRDPRWPDVARRARLAQQEQLRVQGFSEPLPKEGVMATFMVPLVAFYDAARERGEAILYHSD